MHTLREGFEAELAQPPIVESAAGFRRTGQAWRVPCRHLGEHQRPGHPAGEEGGLWSRMGNLNCFGVFQLHRPYKARLASLGIRILAKYRKSKRNGRRQKSSSAKSSRSVAWHAFVSVHIHLGFYFYLRRRSCLYSCFHLEYLRSIDPLLFLSIFLCLQMCMYVFMYVRMYVCMHVCVCMYVCMYVRTYVCVCACMHAGM